MAVNLYNQYVWLIDTIRVAGRITKSELDQKWVKSPLNERNENVYPIRSFHRHREAIAQMFGIFIECDKTNNYQYYIARNEERTSAMLQRRASESLSYINMLFASEELQKRIIFDTKNCGIRHLTVILTAIKNKQAVHMNFLPEAGKFPMDVVPYFLKERSLRWYLAAKPLNSEVGEEVQVYDLSQVSEVVLSKEKASMPRWFKGDMFFDAYFSMTDAPKRQPKPKKAETEAEQKPAAKKVAKKAEEPKKPATAPAVEQLSLF